MFNKNLYERSFGNRVFIIPFTLFLIVWLAGWLAEYLDRELRDVELAQFNYRIKELQSSVLLMNASNVAKDSVLRRNNYVGSNPMEWVDLDWNPINYIGEHLLEDVRDVRGKWVFDPEQGVIAYRPKTMSKTELITRASALDGMKTVQGKSSNRAESSEERLHKNNLDWLRFKVDRLLSKEELLLNDNQHANISLVMVR